MRQAKISRTTKETDITLTLDLDGQGRHDIDVSIAFFKHMLETFARHSAFDLQARIAGDLDVDAHHTVEDTGIVLGQAVKAALGDKMGIRRAGWSLVPMDESLARAAVDISGRPFLRWDAKFRGRRCGDLSLDLLEDFFAAFAASLGASLHLRVEYGRSDHHKIEALVKAAARALREACASDGRLAGVLPSVKEVL
jgi:imidazoleglycerol-phosphate dehydratase